MNKRVVRRIGASLLMAVGALGLIGGTTTATASSEAPDAASSELELISLRMANSPPTPAMSPFFVARDMGFFEEQGIEVEFVTLGSAAEYVPALAGGSVDVINSSIGALGKARESGLDIVITNGHNSGFDYALVTPTGSDLDAEASIEERIASLEGKSIGAQGGAQSVVMSFVYALMAEQGLEPDDVDVIDLAFGGPQLAALQTNQVDLVLADRTTVIAAEEAELGANYFDLLSDPAEDFQGLLISGSAVLQEFVDEHSDFPERMEAAMSAAYAFMQDPANLEQVMQVAIDSVGLPESDSMATVFSSFPSLLSSTVPRAQLERTVEFMYRTGTWTAEPQMTVDDFFLPSMIGD